MKTKTLFRESPGRGGAAALTEVGYVVDPAQMRAHRLGDGAAAGRESEEAAAPPTGTATSVTEEEEEELEQRRQLWRPRLRLLRRLASHGVAFVLGVAVAGGAMALRAGTLRAPVAADCPAPAPCAGGPPADAVPRLEKGERPRPGKMTRRLRRHARAVPALAAGIRPSSRPGARTVARAAATRGRARRPEQPHGAASQPAAASRPATEAPPPPAEPPPLTDEDVLPEREETGAAGDTVKP